MARFTDSNPNGAGELSISAKRARKHTELIVSMPHEGSASISTMYRLAGKLHFRPGGA